MEHHYFLIVNVGKSLKSLKNQSLTIYLSGYGGVEFEVLTSSCRSWLQWPERAAGVRDRCQKLALVGPQRSPSSRCWWWPDRAGDPRDHYWRTNHQNLEKDEKQLFMQPLIKVVRVPLKKNPRHSACSWPAVSSGWSQGTTVTRAPLWARQRIWLYLMPQSTTVIRKLPLWLNTFGSWRQPNRETSKYLTGTKQAASYLLNNMFWDNYRQKLFI